MQATCIPDESPATEWALFVAGESKTAERPLAWAAPIAEEAAPAKSASVGGHEEKLVEVLPSRMEAPNNAIQDAVAAQEQLRRVRIAQEDYLRKLVVRQ